MSPQGKHSLFLLNREEASSVFPQPQHTLSLHILKQTSHSDGPGIGFLTPSFISYLRMTLSYTKLRVFSLYYCGDLHIASRGFGRFRITSKADHTFSSQLISRLLAVVINLFFYQEAIVPVFKLLLGQRAGSYSFLFILLEFRELVRSMKDGHVDLSYSPTSFP